ncbi:VUT family protein [Bartonella bacilliformis]|uniref:Probable queuosine precursor transporter n=1 Tax=Bartonella bacilliformis Ver097 TaxID=1293911 RepID=A0A072R6P7_BARBA|nr:VUT family protein [Bartonella bacilliformis]KEG21341.1 hypothetical protein H710_00290 [Bartonella bacilliformis Ver097]
MSSSKRFLAKQYKGRHIIVASFAMCFTVTISNFLVQYPVRFDMHELLTYGAFTYPLAFLINDLTNRFSGPTVARRVVYAGFIVSFVVSWVVVTPRLAIASSAAFLFGQLLDIIVFAPLRRQTWWKAPLAAAITGSALDTVLFFAIAFAGSFSFIDQMTGYVSSSIIDHTVFFGFDVPVWLSLAFGDFSIKILMSLLMLFPYGVIINVLTLSHLLK